jgi:hypothetical protein
VLCGWRRGVRLTASQMRTHFIRCSSSALDLPFEDCNCVALGTGGSSMHPNIAFTPAFPNFSASPEPQDQLPDSTGGLFDLHSV